MGSKRRKITGRDRMILTLLGEYGCVSAHYIKSQFWSTKGKSRAHYRRIGVLKRHRMIENVRGDAGISIGYRLTKKGKRFLNLGREDKAKPILRKSYKTEFLHDQLLIGIGRTLQKSPLIGSFQTEAEVKQAILSDVTKKMSWESSPTIPDAIFSLKLPGYEARIALELELTMKVKRRYGRIFRSHLVAKNWGVAIYIVKDAKLRDRLMRILDDVRAKDLEVRLTKTINAIYFCLLEDFQMHGLGAQLTNGKRQTSLLEIAQKFSAERTKMVS